MSKEELLKETIRSFRECGFTEKEISDEFISDWFDYYYDKFPNDDVAIFDSIVYEHDLMYYADTYN